MVMSPAGLETKNDCAGEGQQEFTRLDPEGNRLLGRPRLMWENNIKIGLREIEQSGVDWINLAHDRKQWRALVDMNLRIS
jgi:hypothetical protein